MSWRTKMEADRQQSGVCSFKGAAEFQGEYPNLFELLVGSAADGSMAALPAFKLTLFVREGRLRFSCSSADYDQWGIGELDDPALGLASVEMALAEGRLAWKLEDTKKGGRQRG